MLLLVIIYMVCAGLLWLVAFIFGQDGARTSFGAAFGATVLIGIFGIASDYYLKPRIGDTRLIVQLLADVFIIKFVLRLTVVRALITGILFWVILTAAIVVLATQFTKPLDHSSLRDGQNNHYSAGLEAAALRQNSSPRQARMPAATD